MGCVNHRTYQLVLQDLVPPQNPVVFLASHRPPPGCRRCSPRVQRPWRPPLRQTRRWRRRNTSSLRATGWGKNMGIFMGFMGRVLGDLRWFNDISGYLAKHDDFHGKIMGFDVIWIMFEVKNGDFWRIWWEIMGILELVLDWNNSHGDFREIFDA